MDGRRKQVLLLYRRGDAAGDWSGRSLTRGRRLGRRRRDVQQTGASFPGLWLTAGMAKSRWISAASADVRIGLRSGVTSEPFRAPPVRAAVAVVAIAVIEAVAVTTPVRAHFALEPVMAPAFPAPEPGQDGEPALLAVIERLVERIGGIGDLLH